MTVLTQAITNMQCHWYHRQGQEASVEICYSSGLLRLWRLCSTEQHNTESTCPHQPGRQEATGGRTGGMHSHLLTSLFDCSYTPQIIINMGMYMQFEHIYTSYLLSLGFLSHFKNLSNLHVLSFYLSYLWLVDLLWSFVACGLMWLSCDGLVENHPGGKWDRSRNDCRD